MHIVFVCAEYPYENQATGGFGTYVQQLAAALLKKKHQVTIICKGTADQIIVNENLTIRVLGPMLLQLTQVLKLFPSAYVFRLCMFLTYPLGFSWRVYRILVEMIRSSTVDIIEGGDFGAELFFFLLKRRSHLPITIIKLHTPSFVIRRYNEEKPNLFYRAMELLELYSLKHVDALYSPTKNLAKIVTAALQIPVKTVIPYPVSHVVKSGKSIRKQNIILYVGKIQPKKGVLVLTEAIQKILLQLPETKFIFVGPDTIHEGVSTKKNIMKQLRKYKINKQVKFLNELPKTEVYKLYRKAAVTVVPSLWDNFPNVILEAGLHGSPVLATRTGGIPEMITHGLTGILVPPHNSDELASELIELLSKGAKRKHLASQAYHYLIKKYSGSLIAAKTISFYERVAKERREVLTGR